MSLRQALSARVRLCVAAARSQVALRRLDRTKSRSLNLLTGEGMSEHRLIVAAAGILTDGDNVLACQRHHSDPYALQWEFPGGKVEPGEGLESALKRELAEELGIDATIGEEVFRFKHRYPDRFVQMV